MVLLPLHGCLGPRWLFWPHMVLFCPPWLSWPYMAVFCSTWFTCPYMAVLAKDGCSGRTWSSFVPHGCFLFHMVPLPVHGSLFPTRLSLPKIAVPAPHHCTWLILPHAGSKLTMALFFFSNSDFFVSALSLL